MTEYGRISISGGVSLYMKWVSPEEIAGNSYSSVMSWNWLLETPGFSRGMNVKVLGNIFGQNTVTWSITNLSTDVTYKKNIVPVSWRIQIWGQTIVLSGQRSH